LPEGVLFRGDAFARVKKELLENFNLHTVVSLPAGVFLPYSGVKTNLLFFNRTGPTREVWYYEVQPPNGGRFTKGNPIQDEHLADALDMWKERSVSDASWVEHVQALVGRGYDVTAKNPQRPEDAEHRAPQEIVVSLLEKERQIASIVEEIGELLSKNREEHS
ncbi:MAG: N-6 DNA methylase, partial [Candidatus Methylomirabilia bacterium]